MKDWVCGRAQSVYTSQKPSSSSMCTNLPNVPTCANIFSCHLLKLEITYPCFCSKPTSYSLWFHSLNLLLYLSKSCTNLQRRHDLIWNLLIKPANGWDLHRNNTGIKSYPGVWSIRNNHSAMNKIIWIIQELQHHRFGFLQDHWGFFFFSRIVSLRRKKKSISPCTYLAHLKKNFMFLVVPCDS